MEVGTVEPLVKTEEKRKRRAGLSGGSGNPGRRRGGGGGDDGSGGGGGGGDRGRDHEDPRDAVEPSSTKSRILTGFLLLVVLMTFGGLIGAYAVIQNNNVPEWRPFELPIQIWISTFLIVFSSVTYHIAKKAIDSDNQLLARKFLLITTVIGAAFISSQLLAWLALVQRGYYLSGNPYAGFFYILTAVHAVHVLGGIIALGSIVIRSWYDTVYEPEIRRRQELAEVVGWYWHFMGGLWIVLFLMLGFWR